MDDKIYDKLMILGDAAKYDVSCSSSGYSGNKTKKLGNTLASGICHTWSTTLILLYITRIDILEISGF